MKVTTIAVINQERADGLACTIIDGLQGLWLEEKIDFRLSAKFQYILPVQNKVLPREDFIDFARKADWIFLINNGKYSFDEDLVGVIGCWDRTVFIDGSELGKNRRLDNKIVEAVSNGMYKEAGAIRFDLLKKCAGYFRREPPYVLGVTPLPFGIESTYIKYNKGVKKDIDFVCIFGQEDYPPLRREVRKALEEFCIKNNFSFRTSQTKLPLLSAHGRFAKWRFHSLLARTKIGISVSGGGYDTLRFWEILANNCMVLTDTIGIYIPGNKELDYKRIDQFSDLADFKHRLSVLGQFLNNDYHIGSMSDEYSQILKKHSSKSRVMFILNEMEKRNYE